MYTQGAELYYDEVPVGSLNGMRTNLYREVDTFRRGAVVTLDVELHARTACPMVASALLVCWDNSCCRAKQGDRHRTRALRVSTQRIPTVRPISSGFRPMPGTMRVTSVHVLWGNCQPWPPALQHRLGRASDPFKQQSKLRARSWCDRHPHRWC